MITLVKVLQVRGRMDGKEITQAPPTCEEWELYLHPDPCGKEAWGLGAGGRKGKVYSWNLVLLLRHNVCSKV